MRCNHCEEYYKKYPLVKDEDGEYEHVLEDGECQTTSAPIECAFEYGYFCRKNWRCQTMSLLRDIARKFYWERDDDRRCAIGIVPIPENGGISSYEQIDNNNNYIQQGYLVMTWYKNRGRTGKAIVMWDDEGPVKLNLLTATWIIDKYKHLLERSEE